MKKIQTHVMSMVLILLIVCQPFMNVIPAYAQENSNHLSIISETDFSDQDAFGFIEGGGTEVDVDNNYLIASGQGNGNRLITKTFDPILDHAVIQFELRVSFDQVHTDANSSELLLSDANGDAFFRLIKMGGPNGELRYGIGSTGLDMTNTEIIPGLEKDNDWLDLTIRIDYITEKLTFSVTSVDNPSLAYEKTEDFSTLVYVNQLKELSIKGNRASGNTLAFSTILDKLSISGSKASAPDQSILTITDITQNYPAAISIPTGIDKTEVISSLPETLYVSLENGNTIMTYVTWSSTDYISEMGTYHFDGILKFDHVSNVENPNNIRAHITVNVAKGSEAPDIDGFFPVYFTDFGDEMALVPPNWGFQTTNARLETTSLTVAENETAKLAFEITDQSGGRNATKKLDNPVTGSEILTIFDWYPGTINDKGNNPNENGGEVRLLDSSGNVFFTLNNTNNQPLTYFVGDRAEQVISTAFSDKTAWYRVEVHIDLTENQLYLTIINKSTGEQDSYYQSLEDVVFDGSISDIRIAGLRTSGNNLTWKTYMDNLGFYHVPISNDTIIMVNPMPYHRIYVGDTDHTIESLNLPETVTVTTGDGRHETVRVVSWQEKNGAFAPNISGVYAFRGILDPGQLSNDLNREAILYVNNRNKPTYLPRQTEWLDRGLIALFVDPGIFVSWRLRIDEYAEDITFNVYRNDELLNSSPLSVTNFTDEKGKPGDTYRVDTLKDGYAISSDIVTGLDETYLSLPLQKPSGGETATGEYTYTANDLGVGDLTGDGQYEIIVKWYPTNAIDSSQEGMTGPTIFDAYTLEGELLWRIDMGLNLTSGAHYHQFIVADFDGNGQSEFLIKTADATTVYGVTDNRPDPNKIIDVIGNPEDNGRWINDRGHVYGGPEYITVFNGETGSVIDTIDYAFPLGDVASWGDTWHNRSDRFLSGLAYLDGIKPSAIYGRGYYEKTTFVAYSLVDGSLVEEWTFDSAIEGQGGGLGYHSLATGDVDNDGFDEIIAGSLTLDHDGTILYVMDGNEGRQLGSHGDALHVGAFDPNREGLHVFGVHEDPAVTSIELHDGATGETIMSFDANKDVGRGVAANITSRPGYEFWGTGGNSVETGGGLYNVQGEVVMDNYREANLSVNFALYWSGDLLKELLDHTTITKFNEDTHRTEIIKQFEGVVSNNGTKGTPGLQADILGDWREEVVYATEDSNELRIFSTTDPTPYRLYTLMHDSTYRMAVAWQNSGYNQPPHLGFYLGEDISDQVLNQKLVTPPVTYTNNPEDTNQERDPFDGFTKQVNELGGIDYQLKLKTSKYTINQEQINILEAKDRVVLSDEYVDIYLPTSLLKQAVGSVNLTWEDWSNRVQTDLEMYSRFIYYQLSDDQGPLTFEDSPILLGYTVDYNQSDREVGLLYYHEDGTLASQWIEAIEYNTDHKKLIFEVTHFGAYGVTEIVSIGDNDIDRDDDDQSKPNQDHEFDNNEADEDKNLQEPSDEEEILDNQQNTKDEGQQLPTTATQQFNLIFLGMFLLLIAGIIFNGVKEVHDK